MLLHNFDNWPIDFFRRSQSPNEINVIEIDKLGAQLEYFRSQHFQQVSLKCDFVLARSSFRKQNAKIHDIFGRFNKEYEYLDVRRIG